MKKFSKSTLLIGIVLFQSFQISAFGSRQMGEYSLAAVLLACGITQSVAKETAVQEFRTYVHPTNLWKNFVTKPYNYIYPDQFHHLTASEISGIAKEGHLQNDAQKALNDALNPNTVPPIILFTGPAGTGKSTAAKMIASQVDAHSYYTISKSRLDSYCMNQFSNTINDANKIASLHLILTEIANRTPHNKKAVIHLEEFGEEFLETNKAIDLYKDFGTAITGDDTSQPRYSNIVLVGSSNVDHKKIHGAMERRIKLIGLGNPDTTSRIELFKKCDINMQENAQKNAEGKIRSLVDAPTIFDSLASYFWKDAYNKKRHDAIQDRLKNEYLVTDDMITEANNKHKEKLAGFEQDKKNATIPWTLATLFSPELLYSKILSNSSTSYIDRHKIAPCKELGPITPIVTTNFNDMVLKETDITFKENVRDHTIKDKSRTRLINQSDKNRVLEKNARFLAEKTKTKKVNGETKETSADDINKLYKQADLQEQAFIADIKDHVTKDSSEVTAHSNPELFEKMNLHRKYCAETLSASTDKDEKKAVAKISTDKVTSYTIDPSTRTYVAHTTETGNAAQSAPITFGAITTAHLAAAAYGDDFKSYEKKDAAAEKIQKLFKSSKARKENKKSLNNLEAVINDRIKDKKTYTNKPAAIQYSNLQGKELTDFTREAQLKSIEKRNANTMQQLTRK